MNIKPEKIMPLGLSCQEFSLLVYGLLDRDELYSRDSNDKSYIKYFEELDSSKSSPLMIKTGVAARLKLANSLSNKLIDEIRYNPRFNPDLNPRELKAQVNSKGSSKLRPYFKPNFEENGLRIEMCSKTSIAHSRNPISNEMEFNIEDSTWSFYDLLKLCLIEFDFNHEGLEGWVIYLINKYFFMSENSLSLLENNNLDLPKDTLTTPNVSLLESKSSSLLNNEIDEKTLKSIETSETWIELHKHTARAVSLFPSWRDKQSKPNNIQKGLIDDWLTSTLQATKRECETVKKILIDIYNL